MIENNNIKDSPTMADQWIAPETNPELAALPDQLLGEKSWEAKEGRPMSKEYFDYQFLFAKKLEQKTSKPLHTIIDTYTLYLRPEMWEIRDSYDTSTFAPLTDEANIVSTAYKSYLDYTQQNQKPAPYNSNERFGCFIYDLDKERKSVSLHFRNAECDTTGPLDKSKTEQRKLELKDIFVQIKKHCPEATEVFGNSWLYNLEAYRRLFPPQYTASRETDSDPTAWQGGTKVWGQFLSSDGSLKKDLADKFLQSIDKIPSGIPEQEFAEKLLAALPAPPLKVHSSIDKFYEFYAVK